VISVSSASLLAGARAPTEIGELDASGYPFAFIAWSEDSPCRDGGAATAGDGGGAAGGGGGSGGGHSLAGSAPYSSPLSPSSLPSPGAPTGGGTLLLHVAVPGYESLFPALCKLGANPHDKQVSNTVASAVTLVPGYYARQLRDVLHTVVAMALGDQHRTAVAAQAIVSEWPTCQVPFQVTGAIERAVRQRGGTLKTSHDRAERVRQCIAKMLTRTLCFFFFCFLSSTFSCGFFLYFFFFFFCV
jgi:hypothetical protein